MSRSVTCKQTREVGGSLQVHRGSPWCSQNHNPGLFSFPERGARAQGKGHWESTAVPNSHHCPSLPPSSSLSLSLSSSNSSGHRSPSGRTYCVSDVAPHPFYWSFNSHYDTTRLYFPISEMGRVRLSKAQKFGPSHRASKPGQSGQTFNYSVMLPATLMGWGRGAGGV